MRVGPVSPKLVVRPLQRSFGMLAEPAQSALDWTLPTQSTREASELLAMTEMLMP